MAQPGDDVTTLPRLLQHNARVRGGRPAMREKDRGIWQTHTWSAMAQRSLDVLWAVATAS